MKLLLLSVICVCVVYADEKYTNKYDHIDIDDIIKSDRLTRRYLDCTLGKVSCTPEGEELKKHIPDAIQNGCSKCSPNQHIAVKKVLFHLIKNRPHWYSELAAKFDPEDQYKKKFEDHFKKEESNV